MNFRDSVMIIQPGLRSPANMKSAVNVRFTPLHNIAEFFPVIDFFKLHLFDRRAAQINQTADAPWKMVSLSRGMAVYDPAEDADVWSVLRRADKLMYEDKNRYKLAHGIHPAGLTESEALSDEEEAR